MYIQSNSQEEAAFGNCTGSTVTYTSKLPQDNFCKEPIEEPGYETKENVQDYICYVQNTDWDNQWIALHQPLIQALCKTLYNCM